MYKDTKDKSENDFQADPDIKVIDLPPLLQEISDPPKRLFARGNENVLFDPSLKFICIIGSRRHTSYGYDAVRHIISSLKGLPVAIVSGLALGIDSLAHKTALEVGIPCVAVPGSGLNKAVLYPRTHTRLADDIIKNGGVLVSEFDPDMRATPWSFPMRNRIMAGLAHAVVIIEGEEDSGTLITARLALDYNRDVCAVPGSIFSETSKGPLSLIKNGAIPICDPADLHRILNLAPHLILEDAPLLGEEYIHEKTLNCSEEEQKILAALTESRTREELLAQLDIDVVKLQIALSMLEIRGLIIEEYGYIRKIKSIYLAK